MKPKPDKMNKITQFLLILLIYSGLTSCSDQNIIFEEHQDLSPEYTWKKEDVKTFVIDIQQNAHPFEFSIALRVASGYAYPNLPVRIKEIAPDGSVVSRDMDIMVRDSKGDFLGDKGYDIIDIEQVIDAKKSFPTFGKYTYTIEHMAPGIDVLDFPMEIGLIVRDNQKAK